MVHIMEPVTDSETVVHGLQVRVEDSPLQNDDPRNETLDDEKTWIFLGTRHISPHASEHYSTSDLFWLYICEIYNSSGS